jgi:hypothetical protein
MSWAGGTAQAVECLSSEHKALSLKSSTKNKVFKKKAKISHMYMQLDMKKFIVLFYQLSACLKLSINESNEGRKKYHSKSSCFLIRKI